MPRPLNWIRGEGTTKNQRWGLGGLGDITVTNDQWLNNSLDSGQGILSATDYAALIGSSSLDATGTSTLTNSVSQLIASAGVGKPDYTPLLLIGGAILILGLMK